LEGQAMPGGAGPVFRLDRLEWWCLCAVSKTRPGPSYLPASTRYGPFD